MPLIRIDVPEGVSTDIKKQIHSKVREVVLKTLAPKEVKYDYVSIREAFGYIGDGLPVIDVDLRPGRDARRKKALVDDISEVLKETLNVLGKMCIVCLERYRHIIIILGENPCQNGCHLLSESNEKELLKTYE